MLNRSCLTLDTSIHFLLLSLQCCVVCLELICVHGVSFLLTSDTGEAGCLRDEAGLHCHLSRHHFLPGTWCKWDSCDSPRLAHSLFQGQMSPAAVPGQREFRCERQGLRVLCLVRRSFSYPVSQKSYGLLFCLFVLCFLFGCCCFAVGITETEMKDLVLRLCSEWPSWEQPSPTKAGLSFCKWDASKHNPEWLCVASLWRRFVRWFFLFITPFYFE